MNMRKIVFVLTCVLFFSGIIVSVVSGLRQMTAEPEPITEVPVPDIRTITISAAGDCTFGTDVYASQIRSFTETAEEEGYSYFMQNVADIFRSDDFTIVNFEGTLSERGEREDKQFAFRGLPEYAQILTLGGIDGACLANNHSYDYGEISNTDTFDILEQAGVTAFDSTHTMIGEINGITVGLVGMNQLNDVDSARLESAMSDVKMHDPDLIIVCVHWGEEKATQPNEDQIAFGHQAIDLGAALVIGTHPHVLQGIEAYNGGYIAYSLGNFCFGGNDSPADMDTIIYQQTFTFENGVRRTEPEITLIPCTISSDYENGINNYQPTPAEGEKRDSIIEKMNEYINDLGGVRVTYN